MLHMVHILQMIYIYVKHCKCNSHHIYVTQVTYVAYVTESLIVYQNAGQQGTHSMYSEFQPLLLCIWVHCVAIICLAAEKE